MDISCTMVVLIVHISFHLSSYIAENFTDCTGNLTLRHLRLSDCLPVAALYYTACVLFAVTCISVISLCTALRQIFSRPYLLNCSVHAAVHCCNLQQG